MLRARDLRLFPISGSDAARVIKSLHYSGKVAQNSQIHLGVFMGGKCMGALQFGPSISRFMCNLVSGTKQKQCIELNRMALDVRLPKNSESRCLGYALRLIRKEYPHLKWVVSFADACQCGDGAIYRASGFVLTDIRKNTQIRINPDTGEPTHVVSSRHRGIINQWATWKALPGYQLRYVYFLIPSERSNLTVQEIPFDEIVKRGAAMYKGNRSAESIGSDAPGKPARGGRGSSDLGATQ